uniref:HECT-type E3 ubiquitin transferase n=1 Tax=Kalanchoe fedtschenkoi TaxID=63787 RepID=A0A7N0UAZ7_KALFE
MDDRRRNQVSLRGASAKEISRDALLQKVAQERELREYTRRATAVSIFIQRVWRGYIAVKKTAEQLHREWSALVDHPPIVITKTWISCSLLRPFLFSTTQLLIRRNKVPTSDIDCMNKCFRILLASITSSDAENNFCSLATGGPEERRIWMHQARKLLSLGLFILAECNISSGNQKIISLTSLAMRFLITLTDIKGWKCTTTNDFDDANIQVCNLIQLMGSKHSILYSYIRRFICRLDVPSSNHVINVVQADEIFVITATAITFALRPFHIDSAGQCPKSLNLQNTADLFLLYILTIPWLTKRLPAVLLPALKHESILSPCLRSLVIDKDKIFREMTEIEKADTSEAEVISPCGFAIGNIICLVVCADKNPMNLGGFTCGLNYALYVRGVTLLSQDFLRWLDKYKPSSTGNQLSISGRETSIAINTKEDETTYQLNLMYMDLLKPVYQQWHHVTLLSTLESGGYIQENASLTAEIPGNLQLLDIVYFYCSMLKILAMLNPGAGSLPILNMLSFTSGFLGSLWGTIEGFAFPDEGHYHRSNNILKSESEPSSIKKTKESSKAEGPRWANMLNKITGKPQTESGILCSTSSGTSHDQAGVSYNENWDVKPLRRGPHGIPKDISSFLHLFCASYSHLLLVLEDAEFYEKQMPFTLAQQQRITAALNTLVYNGLSRSCSQDDRPLMDSAIKCLHLLYERDSRRPFCSPELWLAPATKSRMPIAAAARTHEKSRNKLDDVFNAPGAVSVITVTPHVFPFEERVQMFREFINTDKASRLMVGEVVGPGAPSLEIEVRRSHIVEDGFKQLRSIGSRFKSSIRVSFLNDCGLPEAGLDYGGLFKEFLTDMAKAAFSPEYGLFCQTATSERLLIPSTAARSQENGIELIEFLGKIVGKALYEGILLDYSFSHVFVQKLLGRYSFLDELSALDPELYKNLMYVKHFEGDVRDLSLDFTVTEEMFGKRIIVELRPGGKDVSVTNENKLQYVHAMADYKLNRQLLSGGKHDIDVDDLKKNTRYSGGYTEGSRTIKLFWEVLTGFEPQQRCMLLKFVTSCSRAPLLGFKHLQPAFTIHKVSCDMPLWATIGGHDVDRLPSASTCYNTLKLPTYKRSSNLKAKLLYAISSNAGFELS